MPPHRAIASLALLSLAAATAAAGPLNPPLGPIASTPGPEPRTPISGATTPGDNDATPSRFKITQPGSYYLTGNVTGFSDRHSIEITASNVTIDLMGFELEGDSDSRAGIVTTVAGLSNIEIRNGTITSWPTGGVDLASASARACRVESIRATGNAFGIAVGPGSTITGCVVALNTGAGIDNPADAAITNCAAYDNGAAGPGSAVSFCTARANGGDGFECAGSCIFTECSATSNDGDGFDASSGCLIQNCVASLNAANGIRTGFESVVRGNTCHNNGRNDGDGAGIYVSVGRTRVENNHCTFNDRGIEVAGPGSLIICNTTASNVIDYVISSNNRYGPIIDITAIANAPVSGSSAPGNINSAHPWANFAY